MPEVRPPSALVIPTRELLGKPQELNSFLLPVMDIFIGTRQRRNHPDVDQMARSLLENGQIHAITVRPVDPADIEDGAQPTQWALVTGGRRLAGAIYAGWTQIRVENLEHLSVFRRNAIELEENLQRRNLTWQEEVDAKKKLTELYKAENPQWADFQTAEILNESKGTISRDLKLAAAMDAHPELAKASSKKAAMRLLDTKQSMARKIMQMESFDVSTIESRMLHCDAGKLLEKLADNCVDLFVSDLPFGIDYFDMPSSDRKAGGGQSKFDDSYAEALKLINRLLPLMLQKVKPDGWIILMASHELEKAIKNQVTIHASQKKLRNHADKAPKMSDRPWIWYRPNSRSNPIHPHLTAKSVYDHIYVINAGIGRLVHPCDNVIMMDSVYDDRIHAHQKPVPLGVELISRTTLPGAFVVDVTMGSGAFLAAAASIQRNFMGSDTNEHMVELARSFVSPYTGGGLAPLQLLAATPQDGDRPMLSLMADDEGQLDEELVDGTDAVDDEDLDDDDDTDEDADDFDDLEDADDDDDDEDEDLIGDDQDDLPDADTDD